MGNVSNIFEKFWTNFAKIYDIKNFKDILTIYKGVKIPKFFGRLT